MTSVKVFQQCFVGHRPAPADRFDRKLSLFQQESVWLLKKSLTILLCLNPPQVPWLLHAISVTVGPKEKPILSSLELHSLPQYLTAICSLLFNTSRHVILECTKTRF